MLHHRGDFHKNVPQNHFQCCQTEGLRFQLGNPKDSFVVHPHVLGFRISLSREGTIFRDEIENYFSCSHLARRDRDYHMTILVIRDESRITYFCSPVSRRDRDLRKSFLVVGWKKMKLTLVENSRDRGFSLTSGSNQLQILYPQAAREWSVCSSVHPLFQAASEPDCHHHQHEHIDDR